MKVRRRGPTGAAAPIFVVGAPRSGTRMVSRILGSSDRHLLITEHRDKRQVPEEGVAFSDQQLWWHDFDFPHGRGAGGRPVVEAPHFDAEPIRRLRETYLELARGRRLVIKNPQNTLRLAFLREMFANARYVHCVRHPWETIQSISIKGLMRGRVHSAFLLKSRENLSLPDDMLLRAAATWAEAQRAYAADRDGRWIAVRYEDVTGDPERMVRALYRWLEVRDEAALERALRIPRRSAPNLFPLLRALKRSDYREEILRRIEPGARMFGYDLSLDAFPCDRWAYYRRRLTRVDVRGRLGKRWKRSRSPHRGGEVRAPDFGRRDGSENRY